MRGRKELRRVVDSIGRSRHESSEGWTEIGAAKARAQRDLNTWRLPS